MDKAKQLVTKGSLAIVGNVAVSTILHSRAFAAVGGVQEGANSAQGTGQSSDLITQIRTITNTMLFAIGVVAVIMLIVGGFRYIFSGGNSQNVNAAKDTILYAVIGIVVALLAYAIVNFILGQFGS